jgi:hypothetical protein
VTDEQDATDRHGTSLCGNDATGRLMVVGGYQHPFGNGSATAVRPP